jgi:hypothetical protein
LPEFQTTIPTISSQLITTISRNKQPLHLPALPPSPTPSSLNPAAFQYMGNCLNNYFDTDDIVSILTHGVQWRIDESKLSQLRGARGYYSNRFPPGAEAWLRNVVNKGIECGHFRYLLHDEASRATIQPVTL